MQRKNKYEDCTHKQAAIEMKQNNHNKKERRQTFSKSFSHDVRVDNNIPS